MSNLHQQEQSAPSVKKSSGNQENAFFPEISANKKEQRYECAECGKNFKGKSNLVNHIFRHNGIKNHKCLECGKRFVDKGDLTRHILIHTGVKNHVCQLCGKRFTQKGALTTHMITHIPRDKRVTNHACQECGKYFMRRSELTKHRCGNNSVATVDVSLNNSLSNCDKEEHSASGETKGENNKENPHVTDMSAHKEKFECTECGKIFTAKTELALHTQRLTCIHVRNHECMECGKKFADKSCLKRHILIHRGIRNHVCPKCGKSFIQKGALTTHMITHIPRDKRITNHACQECGKYFMRRCELTKHRCANDSVATVGVSLNNNMSNCDKEEHSASGETEGEKNKENPHVTDTSAHIKKFECTKCGKIFTTETVLALHTQRLTCTRVRNHECMECGKKFTDKSCLKRHILIHIGIRNHVCPKCGKSFIHKRNLIVHLHTHYGGRDSLDTQEQSTSSVKECEENQENPLITGTSAQKEKKILKCLECGKTFKAKNGLYYHTLRHKGTRNHECQYCGKKFIQSGDLMRHTLVHSGVKDHVCHICGKCFAQRTTLNRHITKHADDENLTSDVRCIPRSSVAVDVGNLGSIIDNSNTQAQSTSGVRECEENPHVSGTSAYNEKFQCTECGKTFMTKKLLGLHTQRHTDGRSHACMECGKKFIDKSDLNKHTLIHRGIRNHVCPKCGESFIQKGNMNVHLCTHGIGGSSGSVEDASLRSNVSNCNQQKQSASSVGKSREDQNNHLLSSISVNNEERKLECSELKESCKVQSELPQHTHKHSGVKYYECLQCNKRFTDKCDLNRHTLIHRGVKNHECPVCSKRFIQRGNLNQHIVIIHTGDINHGSQKRKKTFITHLSDFTRHTSARVDTVNGISDIKCTVNSSVAMEVPNQGRNMSIWEKAYLSALGVRECGENQSPFVSHVTSTQDKDREFEETFKAKNDPSRHTLEHRNVRKYECVECGKIFSEKSDLTKHSLMHSSVREHVCHKCGKKNPQKGNLNQHTRLHSSNRYYECQNCEKEFIGKWKFDLIKHTITHDDAVNLPTHTMRAVNSNVVMEDDGQSIDKSDCDEQNQSTSSVEMLMGDENIFFTGTSVDNEEIELKCSELEKTSKVQSEPAQQKRRDRHGRSYPCPQCGKTFKERSHLRQHLVVHTGEKNYECQQCGKKFTQKSNLSTHTLIHQGVRKYECHYCDRRFIQKGALMSHLRLHTDEKQFECQQCGKKFHRKYDLKNHISRLHTNCVEKILH